MDTEPLKIMCKTIKMKEVIHEGLSLYKEQKKILTSEFTIEFMKRKRISYYEFMNFIYSSKVSD